MTSRINRNVSRAKREAARMGHDMEKFFHVNEHAEGKCRNCEYGAVAGKTNFSLDEGLTRPCTLTPQPKRRRRYNT